MFLRNLVQRREIPLKIAVYLPCAGVGDAMVNLKSLYALKFLYPQAILSLVVKFDTAKICLGMWILSMKLLIMQKLCRIK